MTVDNGNSEILQPNICWHGECNNGNISKTGTVSEDKEMRENSVQIHSRSKRGALAVIGAFMLLKDTYNYVNGILQPEKSETDYLKEAIDGIKKNYNAINRNYKAIQNVEKKVDRNFQALRMVSDLVNSTLSAVEKTRLDILQKIRNSEINFILLHLNLRIDHFSTEMKKIEGLSEKERIDKLLANEGLLKDLEDTRIPNRDSLHTYLHNIIFQGHAIPETYNDKEAFFALNALYYGTQTYVSVMFFLLEQYTYLANYYYESAEVDTFNKYFNNIVNCFDNFKHSLVIYDGYNKRSLINNVINILITVQEKDFVRYTKDISSEMSKRLESLNNIKQQLERMELPVMRDEPEKILGNLEFVQPEIRTPIGEWKDGVQVSYAMQYRNKAIYSKVGKWSDPFTVNDKANLVLTIPTDKKNGKSRVIFRKFSNANVQLVGVLEDDVETNFRDIDRDLYNAALGNDKDKAIKEVNVYVQSGANVNAEFDNGRRAIHAAAQRDNIQLAKEYLINNNSIAILNVKDSDGFTPMHVAAAADHENFIQWLIESGANINERTYSEELTPLHIAACKGFKPTVEALMISNQTDFNAHDNKGFTPLHCAVFSGLHVVQTLISNENVDINAKSNSGLTPLHMSSIENFPDITETLVKSDKIDVDARALGNFTALHFASIFGHIEIIKLLLHKNEIDVNAQSINNWTALHFATSLKKENVVSELLTANNINVNIPADGSITALHLATITNQSSVVRSLLETNAEVEAKTSDGLTALHLAALQGNHEIVSTLIENGANIEGKTSSGQTPLLSAASSKNTTVEVMKILLENGANTKAVDENGESYPWIALKTGNPDVVNFIIREGDEYYVQDGNGNYFLHYAAQGGNFDVVKYLITEQGTFVNIKNFNQEVPLHFAAKSANLEIVQYLIEKERADINAKNKHNETPLYFAVKNGNFDIALYLMEKKGAYADYKELVLLAATGGSLYFVKYLIEKKNTSVDTRDKNNNSLLHLAAKSGKVQLVKYLIEQKDANVLAKNSYHQRPLNFGIQSGNIELVKYLAKKTLSHDIKYYDIDVKDKYGKTPLYYAIRSNKLDLVKYLVSLGAADQPDNIPLHFAIENSNADIVKYLLSIGANINSKGYNNRTPLHIALIRNDSDISQCILDKGGIDVTVKDKFNITSLHLAAQVSLDVVKYLVEEGADINAKRQGDLCSTPLCFAIKVGDFEIVKYLIKEEANINDAVNPEFVSVDLFKSRINNLDTLHFAVSVNNSNVVKYLVNEGAEPNKPPWNGYVLLAIAAMKSNFDLVQYFVEKGSDFRKYYDDYPLLQIAAAAGSLDIVKYLIDKGLDVNVRRYVGETTLHAAADSGNVDLVKYLVEMKGMNPNDVTKFGERPLENALMNGKLENVKYLIEKTEFNINDTIGFRYPPLHASVMNGNFDLVKFLTDRGADINAESWGKFTPLRLAAADFHLNIVKYLVKKNTNINALDVEGDNTVMAALIHNPKSSYTSLMQYLTVRYLIEQGADVSIKNRQGVTLESRAAGRKLEMIKNFLMEYKLTISVRDAIKKGKLDVIDKATNKGANLGFRDKNGSTLLHFAAEKGNLDIAKFLVNKGGNLYAKDAKNKTPSEIAFDNENYKMTRYLENVKRSTENQYSKRDIARHIKNGAGVLSPHKSAKRSISSNAIDYAQSNVASEANRSFSWINIFVTMLLNSFKCITSCSYFFNPSIGVENCKPSTAVKAEEINTNSTLLLLDVIIKKITGQKYIYTEATSISLAEANSYVLDIVSLFERAVRQAALYSAISLHRLNIDFMTVQKDCVGKAVGNKFSEIPEILKLHLERACPGRAAGCSGKLSTKKFDKLTDEFNNVLYITMSQYIQNILQNKIVTEEVGEVKGQPLGLEYKNRVGNASVHYVRTESRGLKAADAFVYSKLNKSNQWKY